MVECRPFDIVFIPKVFKGTHYGLVYETRKGGCLVSPLYNRTSASGEEDMKIFSTDLEQRTMSVKNFRVGLERRIVGLRDVRKNIGHLKTAAIDRIIRDGVFRLVDCHFESVHNRKKPFVPGQSAVPYGGRVYDQEELRSLVDSGLDFWLTAGRFEQEFTKRCEKFLGIRHCLLTNSGSSANLLAVSALTSPVLRDRRLRPGDEVITAACAFPTTVNPIVQNRLVPVFLDVDMGTYNIQPERLAAAVSKKTKAIILAHTLGNPFDLDAVMSVARKHRLWVIEDNCDALGSRFRGRCTGTFGDMASLSFYPPHHITMGEGGGVVTGDARLKRLVESFRDWGRDCWCQP